MKWWLVLYFLILVLAISVWIDVITAQDIEQEVWLGRYEIVRVDTGLISSYSNSVIFDNATGTIYLLNLKLQVKDVRRLTDNEF